MSGVSTKTMVGEFADSGRKVHCKSEVSVLTVCFHNITLLTVISGSCMRSPVLVSCLASTFTLVHTLSLERWEHGTSDQVCTKKPADVDVILQFVTCSVQ